MNEILSFLLQQAAVVVFMGLVIWTQQKEKNDLKAENKVLVEQNSTKMLAMSEGNAIEVKDLNIKLNNRATDAIEAITENSVAINALHSIVKELKDDLK